MYCTLQVSPLSSPTSGGNEAPPGEPQVTVPKKGVTTKRQRQLPKWYMNMEAVTWEDARKATPNTQWPVHVDVETD